MFTPRMSTIVATTALIVAVFGSTPLGQAAAQMVLPENSVGTKQLKTSAVTSAKVKDHSLLASDFQTGQLPAGSQGPKGDTGAQGAKGDAGAAGPKGDKGDPGLAGVEVVETSVVLYANSFGAGQAYCPAGKKPVAGGGAVPQGSPAYITSSIPAASNSQSPNAWFVNWHNTKAANVKAYVYVVCATVS